MDHDGYEIKYSAIKNYFAKNDVLFGMAESAVVRGCVISHSFDVRKRKFEGIVTSLKGTKSYTVEIFVTDEFLITFATCECPAAQICHHIGALALSSGYKLPIFSYETDNEVTDIINIFDDTEPLQQRSTEQHRRGSDENKYLQQQDGIEPTDDHHPHPQVQKLASLCEICGKIFRNLSYLKIHRISHRNKVNYPITCFLCQRDFKTFYGLQEHQRKHWLSCGICSFRSDSTFELEKHMSIHKDKPKKRYECNECGKFFSSNGKRSQHRVAVHMYRERYKCPDCPEKFGTLARLEMHSASTGHTPVVRIYEALSLVTGLDATAIRGTC